MLIECYFLCDLLLLLMLHVRILQSINQSIKSQGSVDVTVDDLYVNTKVGGDMSISSSTPTSPDSTATTPEVSGVVQEDLLYVNTQVGGGFGGSTTGGKLRKLSVSGFLFCFTLLFLPPPHFAYNNLLFIALPSLFSIFIMYRACQKCAS